MSKKDLPTKTSKKLGARIRLTHGIYAKDILPPWESRADFEKMHADLKLEFLPRGRAEEEAVLDLALLHWHKHTLWRLRQSELLKDPFMHDIVQTHKKSWTAIRKQLREISRNERTMIGTLEGNLQKLAAQMQRLQQKMETSTEREELATLQANMQALTDVMGTHAIPLLQQVKGGPDPESSFEQAYAPQCLEKIYQLEAILDARIAKVLSRLVGIKEFKRTPAGQIQPELPSTGPIAKTPR